MRDREKRHSAGQLNHSPSLRPSVSPSSSSPHVIRLREPWERQRLDNGSLRLTRRFHRPTGLDEKSRVWLVVEDMEAAAEIALNEHVLGRLAGSQESSQHAAGTAHAVRFEITQALQPENVISIVLRPVASEQDPQACKVDSVRLEIEEAGD
jgi:hypothetical protein